jgi:hypothetical protein
MPISPINLIFYEGLTKLDPKLKMHHGPSLNYSLPKNLKIINIHVYNYNNIKNQNTLCSHLWE